MMTTTFGFCDWADAGAITREVSDASRPAPIFLTVLILILLVTERIFPRTSVHPDLHRNPRPDRVFGQIRMNVVRSLLLDVYFEAEHGRAGLLVDAFSRSGDREAVGSVKTCLRFVTYGVFIDHLDRPILRGLSDRRAGERA